MELWCEFCTNLVTGRPRLISPVGVGWPTQPAAYTDSRLEALDLQFAQLSDDVWQRLGQQYQRINRQGAMSTAMMSMAINAANSRSPRDRVAVGAGWQNGESALSVGYSK